MPEWTPIYLGFLLFVLAVITYRLPVGRVGILLGLLGLVSSRKNLRLPLPLVALTALVLLAAIGVPTAVDPHRSLDQLDEAAKLWFIALVGYNAIRTPKQFRFVLFWVVALYAFVPVRPVLIGYARGITSAGRAYGPFTYVNPNDLAAITLLALGATLCAVTTERLQKPLRLLGYGFAGTLVVMIFLTQSRAGFLGLAMMGIPYLVSSARRGFAPIALMLAAAAAAAVFVPSKAWNRLGGILKLTDTETIAQADPEGSAAQRFELLKTALTITRDHPLMGIGLGGYSVANAAYRPDIGYRDAHNTYLRMAAELGLPGLSFFLVMVGAVWKAMSRARRSIAEASPSIAVGLRNLQLGLLGFLVAGLFGSYGWQGFFHVFLAIMWSGAALWTVAPAAARARAAVPRSVQREPPPSRRAGRSGVPVPRRGG